MKEKEANFRNGNDTISCYLEEVKSNKPKKNEKNY